MSENQNRRAKRLVEILDEMGYLRKGKTVEFSGYSYGIFKVSLVAKDASMKEDDGIKHAKEKLAFILAEALTRLEAEELKLIMKKARK